MSSLAMQGIERDQAASEPELTEQRLSGRDLVGLFANVAVRQHQRGAGGEDAEHLCGGAVAELVEAAAQRLAIDRQAGRARLSTSHMQQAGMAAEDGLECAAVEALQDVADRGVRRCAPPRQAKGPVQTAAVLVDEGGDAAV